MLLKDDSRFCYREWIVTKERSWETFEEAKLIADGDLA